MTTEHLRPPAPAGFDPVSEQGFDDPASIFAGVDEDTPVFWYPPLGVWVATRRSDVEQVLTDWQTWPSGPTDEDAPPPRAIPEVAAGVIGPELMTELMVGMNPPKHTAARRAAQAAFLKPLMEALQPEIEARAHRIVDRFAHDGSVDLMNEYCLELTTQTILALLDLPDDQQPMMQQLREDHFAILASGAEPIPEPRLSEVWGRYAQAHLALREVVAERRAAGQGSDVVTIMASARDAAGDPVLSDERIALHLCEFAAAGTDTTAQAMANAVVFLSRHQEQLQDAIEDPGLWPEVFEETVRRRPSAPFAARFAADDTEIGGVTVPRGEMIWLALASANTSPEAVEDGLRFDIHRDDKTHLAFTKGRHTCLGAPLARTQGATGLQVLFSRLPSLRTVPDQPLDFLPLAMLPVRRSLQVQWDVATA